MKYLECNLLRDSDSDDSSNDKQPPLALALSGVVMMCSVPPSGNGKMTMRFLQRSLVDSWKITAGLAMKKSLTNQDLCRDLFFGDDETILNEDLERFQGYFKRDTVATIDLMDLAKQLPSVHVDDGDGKAVFLKGTDHGSGNRLASLVIGAKDDFIVDAEGVEETARYYGVEPVVVDSPHDVMLGNNWENGANAIKRWLEEEVM